MSTIDKALAKKNDALAARERGEFAKAAEVIAQAIDSLIGLREDLARERETDKSGPGRLECEAAAQLAHFHGSKGGIFRRWARETPSKRERSQRLRAAVAAYDQGYELEAGIGTFSEYRIVNSYNTLQRLVCRILLRPDALETGDAQVEDVKLIEALEAAEKMIEAQLAGLRRNDAWAMADLALTRALIRDDKGRAWDTLLETKPPQLVLSLVRDVASEISEVVGNRPALHDVYERLHDAVQAKLAPKEEPIVALRVRPTCFIAMPFGTRKSPDGTREINFDDINALLTEALEDAGIEPIRADEEEMGGSIHRPMIERLLVSEYAIGDLTFQNANVAYEVGMRHGASESPTLLICDSDEKLPFDVAFYRVRHYKTERGILTPASRHELRNTVRRWVHDHEHGRGPVDNPVLQLTRFSLRDPLQHQKADVFIERMRYTSEVGKRVAEALEHRTTARSRLRELKEEAFQSRGVPQLHSALLSIYLGFRECQAYEDMEVMFHQLPDQLKSTDLVIEQYALALGRLAEHAAKTTDDELEGALALWRKAERILMPVREQRPSSENWSIHGRLLKGRWRAFKDRSDASGILSDAIAAYEEGFRCDPRDFFPGVNAITLRLTRGSKADKQEVAKRVPVVEFALEREPNTKSGMEKYWRRATRLELACAGGRWEEAKDALKDALAADALSWMRNTTVQNLRDQLNAWKDDPAGVECIESISKQLEIKSGAPEPKTKPSS